MFKPIELDEKTHATKETNENFLFKIEDKEYIYVGEKIFTYNTIEKYFSESGFNDVKYPFALGKENVYCMLYQKYITIEEYQNSKKEDEYQNL